MVEDLDKVIEAEKKQVDAIQGGIECIVASITGSTEVVDAVMHHGSDTEFVCMKRDLERQMTALSNQPLVQLTKKLNVKFSQSQQGNASLTSLFGALEKTHVSTSNPAPQTQSSYRSRLAEKQKLLNAYKADTDKVLQALAEIKHLHSRLLIEVADPIKFVMEAEDKIKKSVPGYKTPNTIEQARGDMILALYAEYQYASSR